MNQHDRKQLEIAHLKLDDMRQDLVDLKRDMEKAHVKTDESLSFIKENLFNPHEGLWAETKENTRFRENSQKWRSVIGIGFFNLGMTTLVYIFIRFTPKDLAASSTVESKFLKALLQIN